MHIHLDVFKKTKGNYKNITDKLNEYDWILEFMGLSTQQMYTKLCLLIRSLVDRYLPVSDRDISKPPWTFNPPRGLVQQKSRLFAVLCKDVRSRLGRGRPSTEEAWREFTQVNNELKNIKKPEASIEVCPSWKKHPKGRYHTRVVDPSCNKSHLKE